MNKYGILQRVSLLLVILLSGCGSSPNVVVNELNSNITYYDEIIRINNCGGKADSEQVASRSFTTAVEGGAEISAGYQSIVEGSVSAKYSQYRNTAKAQRLIAPPGTNMEFTLRWSEEVRAGNVTANGSSGNYEVRIPISVEQISSQDLGCQGTTTETAGPDDNSPEIVFEPTNGKLDQIPVTERGIAVYYTGLWLKNFIVQVKFRNSFDTSASNWDYGIGFRAEDVGQEYRLYVMSDNTWQLYLSGKGKSLQDAWIITGQLNNLDTSMNGTNEIKLIAQDEKADFFLNGELIANLDLSEKNVPGDIYVGTGFLSGPETSGAVTEYSELTVWKLP